MNAKTYLLAILSVWYLLLANTTFAYTRQDTLRGSNGTGRSWWDVTRYDLHVTFDTAARSITGSNTISFTLSKPPASDSMQIDLQEAMLLDSVVYKGRQLPIVNEGNVWWCRHPFSKADINTAQQVTAYYHGQPRVAKNAPWEGGFIWTRDTSGKLWLAVACQGLGASAWWPCKDLQSDEPDKGADIRYTVPGDLQCISNGRLIDKSAAGQATTWHWRVSNPINTYNITFYIGDYIGWKDTVQGEAGTLEMSYYALRSNEAKARKHFEEARPMIHCFEKWMGPYPFYEDGYKLVEAPFLGMEHQSGVAYGNEYKKGYKGMDRSGTGVGMSFDYIIVHESGHEWFGNNITAADIADNWIQEGFTTYSETMYAECLLGREKAFEYLHGEWHNIRNDRPIIGDYGVNDDGSGDKYDKGAAIVHMIRMMMKDDGAFRNMLRGMGKEYYHKMVTTREIEDYISRISGLRLQPFFDQYLRTTQIPELEWYIKNKQLYYRFTNITQGFSLPIEIKGRRRKEVLTVTGEWQSINWKKGGYNFDLSKDFLFRTKE